MSLSSVSKASSRDGALTQSAGKYSLVSYPSSSPLSRKNWLIPKWLRGQHATSTNRLPGVVGHLVHSRVGEVSEDVGKVQASHGELRDDHLGERGEGTVRSARLRRIGPETTHLKTPWRSALNAPKPAAAEKLPRSMIPLDTNTLDGQHRPSQTETRLTLGAFCESRSDPSSPPDRCRSPSPLPRSAPCSSCPARC